MVKLALHSIAYEAKTLNLAKEGYTAFYVDGTDGLDIHDGGSWAQAFKTIQHAIDEAGSWCKIFIKEGTYVENVTITKDHIHLIGNDKGTTIINPATGNVVVVSGNDCTIEELYGKAVELTKVCFIIGGKYNTIHDCMVYGSNVGLSIGVSIIGENCKAFNIFNIAETYMGVYSAGDYNEIYGCLIDDAYSGVLVVGNKNKVYNNEFRNCRAGGVGISIGGDNNSIYHNNSVSNNKYTKDYGAGNKWFENYYSDHTADTNNDGMADSSRTEDGATDYQPVSKRNGWEQSSLPTVGAANESFTKVTKTITLGTGTVPVTETLFTVTGEVECYVVGYIDAAVTSAGALTLEVGIAGDTAGLIAQTAVGALLIDLMWMDATPATLISKPSEQIIANGADIIHTIAAADATAGAITYNCWWRAISSDGNVVAA